jgi:hypothetical protein
LRPRSYASLDREFDSLVVAHCKRTDLFKATAREDRKNDRVIVRVEFAKLEGDILLSLGDFIYNLRSGLDQLAWQLCLAGGGNPGRDTMFPIFAINANFIDNGTCPGSSVSDLFC